MGDESPARRPAEPQPPGLIEAIRARTPARVLVGRAGPSYRTATQLELRQDHAAAVDAVRAEIDLERDLGRARPGRGGPPDRRAARPGDRRELVGLPGVSPLPWPDRRAPQPDLEHPRPGHAAGRGGGPDPPARRADDPAPDRRGHREGG